jgi:predicted nucleic acid-binding protein
VFVDTGGWMACADRSDPAHVACTAARDATLEAGRLLITTDFVVDETLTLIRFRLGLAAASAWWQQIDGSARLRWSVSRATVSNERGTSFSNTGTRTCRSRTAQASRLCAN